MGLAAQAHLPPRAAHFRVDLRFFAGRASVFIGERIALGFRNSLGQPRMEARKRLRIQERVSTAPR
jgi:hypothetical protein